MITREDILKIVRSVIKHPEKDFVGFKSFAELCALADGLLKERDEIQSKLDLMCHDQVKRLESYEELFKQSETARQEFAKEIKAQSDLYEKQLTDIKADRDYWKEEAKALSKGGSK